MFGAAAAFAVAAFLWGLSYGINLGVEETTRFYLELLTPEPKPIPLPTDSA